MVGGLVVVSENDYRIGLAWKGDGEVMLATKPLGM